MARTCGLTLSLVDGQAGGSTLSQAAIRGAIICTTWKGKPQRPRSRFGDMLEWMELLPAACCLPPGVCHLPFAIQALKHH